MSVTPLVTIGITCYDAEPTIARAVDSALARRGTRARSSSSTTALRMVPPRSSRRSHGRMTMSV